MSILLTKEAKKEMLNKVSMGNEKKDIRIYVKGIGWGGPTFGLTLDSVEEKDYIEKFEDFNVLIKNDLIDQFGNFKVDFVKGWLGKQFVILPDHGGSKCS